MRLGQLARKLNINTSDIVDLLKENHIEINDHPNVKIEGERELIVLNKYPLPEEPVQEEILEEILEEKNLSDDHNSAPPTTLPEQEKESIDIPQVDVINELEVIVTPEELSVDVVEEVSTHEESFIEEEISIEGEETKSQEEDLVDSIEKEEIEIIRAPKIALEGLKVIGKIELPEPKVKEEKSDETTEKRPKRQPKNYRRELTEEEKAARRVRNREAKERREQKAQERERQQREDRERKAKEEHYRQKLAAEVKATKARKRKKKKENQKNDLQNKKIINQPETLLGKFWKWLNT